jgi:cytochrome bd ubiquinol oxidase subunit I
MDIVALSRLQFAITALYHFLFVPLTLGLAVLLAIMESIYVISGREIWRDIVKFWGVLFGINFAMGVATGITMEFQFGTNWAYYSHYVGDIFGAPLAIEGMMAFFLEATFVGLFFFGWNKMSKKTHLFVTWMVALGTNLSAVWILIANGWMQFPAGARFNADTMRMEVVNFADVVFNPVAQVKFLHTISAGYVTGSIFVLAISAYYLLRKKNADLAKRSMTVAAAFGLCASLCTVLMGDESGFVAGKDQKMKVAAIEAEWHTQSAPAAFTLVGLPSMKDRDTKLEVKIPYVLGIIATRSLDTPVLGIDDLVARAKARIENGMVAYDALVRLKADRSSEAMRNRLEEHVSDLGYALLLKRFRPDVQNATPDQIEAAAQSTVPDVPVLFWSFRFMVGLGFFFILLFATSYWLAHRQSFEKYRWYLWIAALSLPLPWIAAELGWVVAEYGRQPWVIDGVLPTALGVSSTVAGNVLFSLIGFVLFYSTLAVADVFLMVKYVRLGPEGAIGKAIVAPAAAE